MCLHLQMKSIDINIPTLAALPGVVERFIATELPRGRVFALHAPMGGGKTTFTAELCRQIGVADGEACSPTFAIINHYLSPVEGDIYHFDFYRLEDASQARDVGAEEYLLSGALCLVEWGENAPEILPEDTIHVNIHRGPEA